MPTAHGTIVGYNAQVAVDAKHKLIAADDVTNQVPTATNQTVAQLTPFNWKRARRASLKMAA